MEQKKLNKRIPWNKDKTGVYTKEQLEDITLKTREAMKRPDVLKRLSDSHKGYILPQSQKDKISKGNKGKIRTELHKEHYRKARALKTFKYYDTDIEIAMRNALEKEGILFKTHVPLKGQPDVFIEPNICVFVDGDYWHGNPFMYTGEEFLPGKTKIKEKWEYDKNITNVLKSQGYRVLRFWGKQIKPDATACVEKIKETIIQEKQPKGIKTIKFSINKYITTGSLEQLINKYNISASNLNKMLDILCQEIIVTNVHKIIQSEVFYPDVFKKLVAQKCVVVIQDKLKAKMNKELGK